MASVPEGGTKSSNDAAAAAWEAENRAARDSPTKPAELVVMSWGGGWDRGLRRAVSDPFTVCTGIAVRHALHIGLVLPSHLLASLHAGTRPPFDIVWSNGVPALGVARDQLSYPLSVDAVPNLTALHPRAQPEGSAHWPVVMVYAVYYVLAYRESAFPGPPPTSWQVLLDPRHRGKIALYPGGNGFYPIAQLLGGGSVADIPDDMSACWRYLRQLAPQIGALAYSIGMEQALRRGQLDICFRALPNALAFRAQGLDVSWTAPVEGITDTADALWIPRNVPENVAYWAQRYIDFALSRSVHEHWCNLLGVIPMRRDLRPSRALQLAGVVSGSGPEAIETPAGRILYLPERLKLKHEAEWERRFGEIVN